MFDLFRAVNDTIESITADEYEVRKVARIEPKDNNGIGVSTAWVPDEKMFETALIDQNGVHPIERYTTKDKAKIGHNKWVEFSRNNSRGRVMKLFWSWAPEMNKEIILEPY